MNSGLVVMIGFGHMMLSHLDQLLPPRSVLVVEAPESGGQARRCHVADLLRRSTFVVIFIGDSQSPYGSVSKPADDSPDVGRGRADQRPEQRAGTADRGLHHQLPRRIEHEGVRRHEALHDAEKPPGEAGVGSRNDERRQFVALDIVTHGGGTQRIVADGAQHGPDGRTYDTQRDHEADEKPEREERVQRPVGVELDRREAEVKARRRDARQPVSPPV